MLSITLDRDLERRLIVAARRLGRRPEDCVVSSVRAFVEDCEEAAARAAQLGGVLRPGGTSDFWD